MGTDKSAGIQFLFTPDMLDWFLLQYFYRLGFSSYLPLICLTVRGGKLMGRWDSVLIYP